MHVYRWKTLNSDRTKRQTSTFLLPSWKEILVNFAGLLPAEQLPNKACRWADWTQNFNALPEKQESTNIRMLNQTKTMKDFSSTTSKVTFTVRSPFLHLSRSGQISYHSHCMHPSSLPHTLLPCWVGGIALPQVRNIHGSLPTLPS